MNAKKTLETPAFEDCHFWQITFKGGRRTGYGHESTWYGDAFSNYLALQPGGKHREYRTQITVVPKQLYSTPNDLPTHRREIDLYPEFHNLRR